MSLNVVSKWRAALTTSLLNDAMRANLLAGIQKVAPQSTLMQNPAIAASYAALGTSGATLATSVVTAAATKQQHVLASDQRDTARVAFDLEITAFKSLVEAYATNAEDITGMGLTLLSVTKGAKTTPDVPAPPIIKIGKQHGKARVSIPGKGYVGRFVAQASPDPMAPGSFVPLPGNGKSRTLTGVTGTKLWVQFALVRWGLQSAWTTPVLVTLP
jgi:hypothetical protein